MQLETDLTELGLTKSEVKIYLYLLEHGLKTPANIAKSTGVARTNTYHVLELLIDKGLVSEQKEGLKKAYIARDPNALASALDKKREVLQKLLPGLRNLHTSQKNKPSIKFYSGINEAREVYAATLSAEQVLALGSTRQLGVQDADLLNWYKKSLKENGVLMKDLLSFNSGESVAKDWQQHLKSLYEYRLLPKKYDDIPADLLIWNDSVAMISLEAPVFATVVTNPAISSLWRTIHGMLWELLPRGE